MLNKLVKFIVILFVMCSSTNNFAAQKFIDRPEVQKFITQMVHKHKFKRLELIGIFSTVHVRKSIMRSIKVPLEAKPWYEYKTVFVNPTHIRKGVEFWKRYESILKATEKLYGVPASIIVATIGVETMYGKNKGEYPVIEALTNIAFSDSKRAKYFRKELEEFLLLAREQGLNPLTIKGSYAGAIGQPQFMPSSYRYYAVSYSGKKRIDLNNSEADIIASIANYYKKHGWKTNQPVAIPTLVEKNQYRALLDKNPNTIKTHKQLTYYGIFPYYKVPASEKINLIQLQSTQGSEYWIALNNFNVIKRYNPNNLYAMAVYQLSSYITILKERLNNA